MLPQRFWVFQKKKSFIKKSVEQSQNKKCKNVTIISYKSLSSKVYDSFILKLWYYDCNDIVEITENTDFFQNTCFKESYNMTVEGISNYLETFTKKH